MAHSKFDRLIKTIVAVSFLATAAVLVSPRATAAVEGSKETSATAAKTRTKRTPALREATFKRLSKAQDLIDQEKYDDALAVIEKLRARKLNSYESAMAWNLAGYIHYSREHYKQAIAAYDALIQEDAIPESLRQNTLFSLAKLYFVTEEYDQAIKLLTGWEKQQTNPGMDTYLLLGQAYYQTGQYREVIAPMNKAIELATARGMTPKENWYLLLRGAYFQLQDYAAMRDVLERLVEMNPKRDYLVQLAAVYGELNQVKQQTSVLLAAYERGLLEKESEIVNLAYLMLGADVPYKSGVILTQAMDSGVVARNEKNLKLLADCWVMAKEHKQAASILKQAAELSNDSDIYVQLAQVHLDQKNWSDAAEFATRSVKVGSPKHAETAYLVAGIAYFNLGELQSSKTAFAEAKKFSNAEKSAKQWMAFVEQEISRKAALAQADSKT